MWRVGGPPSPASPPSRARRPLPLGEGSAQFGMQTPLASQVVAPGQPLVQAVSESRSALAPALPPAPVPPPVAPSSSSEQPPAVNCATPPPAPPPPPPTAVPPVAPPAALFGDATQRPPAMLPKRARLGAPVPPAAPEPSAPG